LVCRDKRQNGGKQLLLAAIVTNRCFYSTIIDLVLKTIFVFSHK
jgi:hypothetical protein